VFAAVATTISPLNEVVFTKYPKAIFLIKVLAFYKFMGLLRQGLSSGLLANCIQFSQAGGAITVLFAFGQKGPQSRPNN